MSEQIFFTADTHFGHSAIIRHCNRPFSSVEEMDAALIANWNATVPRGGIVYHLGDFAFGNAPDVARYLSALNGQVHLILGNHDKKPVMKVSGFASKQHYKYIRVADILGNMDQYIVLMHYAMRRWHKSHYGAWMLYGHTHGSLPEIAGWPSFDVGVDTWNYTPVPLSLVREKVIKIAGECENPLLIR